MTMRDRVARFNSFVIAGLDPAIHGCRTAMAATWMPGSSPGMTIKEYPAP